MEGKKSLAKLYPGYVAFLFLALWESFWWLANTSDMYPILWLRRQLILPPVKRKQEEEV